jgi:NAD+ synthase
MFSAMKTANEIIDFIREYYNKNNIKGAVIGISGGKDSGVVAGLFAKAIGSENVVGVWMPCHSNEMDHNNAMLVASTFGFKLIDVDLTDIYDNYVSAYNGIYPDLKEDELVDANINIKPRLRMATLYYNAALLSSKNKGLYIVPGTSNKCELFVGYFTKGGDNVADIQVLADLTVDEVIEVGKYIGVPDRVVNKAPDDGLSGKTDEEKLGVKYRDIACLMNGLYVPQDEKVKILDLHNRNMHKFNIPTYKKK